MNNSTPLTEAIFYILLAVRSPNHGYGIIQEIKNMTEERLILGPGTLYGAINSMLKKGWIRLYSEEKQARKKKEYLITEEGKEAFDCEVIRLNELRKNSKLMDK